MEIMTANLRTTPYANLDASQSRASSARRIDKWVLWFILFQIACQLALLSNSIGGMRAVVRIATFASSIGMMFVLQGRGPQHPSTAPAFWILGIVAVMLFFPTTNLLAGVAQAAMYLAILAPLF